MADSVYTLWYLDYDELMQLGRYFTRRQSDSLERFPGVRELPSYQAPAPSKDEAVEGDKNAVENAENADA